jgi:hypothetical protein
VTGVEGSKMYICRGKVMLPVDVLATLYVAKKKCEKSRYIFYVLLTAHIDSVLVNNQLDVQFFFRIYIYSNSLHVSNTPVLT